MRTTPTKQNAPLFTCKFTFLGKPSTLNIDMHRVQHNFSCSKGGWGWLGSKRGASLGAIPGLSVPPSLNKTAPVPRHAEWGATPEPPPYPYTPPFQERAQALRGGPSGEGCLCAVRLTWTYTHWALWVPSRAPPTVLPMRACAGRHAMPLPTCVCRPFRWLVRPHSMAPNHPSY